MPLSRPSSMMLKSRHGFLGDIILYVVDIVISRASKIGLLLLAVVTMASAAPVVSVLVSSMAASALGCPLDEGSAHPCSLAGADIGETLYTAFVLGWLMLLTAPVMFATAIVWIVIGLRALRRRRAGQAAG